jgi:glycosyltransferase involved in cell wall biosynthesis
MAMTLLKKTRKIQELNMTIDNRKYEMQELIERCDFIFIYGKWFKQLLNENGYYSPKLKMIPHISKLDFERKEYINTIKYKLLFVGRIEKAKGLHLLVKAMNTLCTKNVQLDVAGNIVDKKYFDNCKEIFSFDYKGILPRKSLLQTFPDYDFLVLPSVFTEMYSLVLKEASYEQLPVIVSSAKGNRDVVTDGINGFLFKYDDAQDLAKTIDKAYQLIKEGWLPQFEQNKNQRKDLEEILSYYQIADT